MKFIHQQEQPQKNALNCHFRDCGIPQFPIDFKECL